jgi:hypothetical protein
MPNAATQETPFFLVHGTEAVLPVEITHEAPRIVAYDETTSTEALQDDVDALDEARDVALARAMQYQQSLQNCHDPGFYQFLGENFFSPLYCLR